MGGEAIAQAELEIGPVTPGIFVLPPSRVPAGFALIADAEGNQRTQELFRLGPDNIFIPKPIDLTDESEQMFLPLFAAGVRGRTDLSAVIAEAGGVEISIGFVGAQGQFASFDQINLGPLNQEQLSGRGRIDLAMTFDGFPANLVELEFAAPLLTPVPMISSIDPTAIMAGAQTLVSVMGTNLGETTSAEV